MKHACNIPDDGKTACGLEITENIKVGWEPSNNCSECRIKVYMDIVTAISYEIKKDLIETLFNR